MLKTHDEFWAPVRDSISLFSGDSDGNPKIGLICSDHATVDQDQTVTLHCEADANPVVEPPWIRPLT